MRNKETYLVFVYGTLRKGGTNDHYLKKAKLISSSVWVKGELHDTGYGYPVLKERSSRRIVGELYEVTSGELTQLDYLEDFKPSRARNEYERVIRTVYMTDKTVEAFVYVEGERLTTCEQMIEENDWMVYQGGEMSRHRE
ncbi:butirosin biosynthesis protein BtrG [Halalkalibacter wakoensis JCM 9140]|uniref:Gamma-glutamylcyclotransferase family protein n=1 Tax=Halalkalibacter wakoensis JCM 9140 TaxID=1236970 RepID=W4PXD8_9BACI|nr:gamma-glutamylcyclotransferase family protein [Halalkalibacter wakoensis]GAE24501.1 butirosin biosynthesis protein BtrG [Halalkalibacter wakoensis JCM 9140]